MAKQKRFYWDTCAWLGLINREEKKVRELEIIYNAARAGHYELWTSTMSIIECNRLSTEMQTPKPLPEEGLDKIHSFFQQPFIKLIPIDSDIARNSQRIFRATPKLTKKPDAVHLASALRWSVDALHTYDKSDLLHLSGKFLDRSGNPLTICFPDDDADGPLFSVIKKN